MSAIDFTEEQIDRYSRHIILEDVGGAGQAKLLGSSVFVVGAGGLGSPSLLYLAAAGVGRIGFADSDAVELSNLQRQVIHGVSDIGKNKALSAEDAIRALNPDCRAEPLPERLAIDNVREIAKDYDLILDGSDNFPTRFLVADACWFEGKPLVTAAVLRFEGQLMTVAPGEDNPCYRCTYPEPPPADLTTSCREAGVLGTVVGVMGVLQATEALKTILGIGKGLSRRMLVYDALGAEFRTLGRRRDPECPLCGEKSSISTLAEVRQECCPGGQCSSV